MSYIRKLGLESCLFVILIDALIENLINKNNMSISYVLKQEIIEEEMSLKNHSFKQGKKEKRHIT